MSGYKEANTRKETKIDRKNDGYSFLQNLTTGYQQHLLSLILANLVDNLIRSFRKFLIRNKYIIYYRYFIRGLETFNSVQLTKSIDDYVHSVRRLQEVSFLRQSENCAFIGPRDH